MEKTFIIVRSDIDPGLQLAQSVHAAIAFTAAHGVLTDNVVVLHAKSAAELRELCERARALGARCEAFEEPDLGGELTAAALAPEARRLVSSLPLALRQRRAQKPRLDDVASAR